MRGQSTPDKRLSIMPRFSRSSNAPLALHAPPVSRPVAHRCGSRGDREWPPRSCWRRTPGRPLESTSGLPMRAAIFAIARGFLPAPIWRKALQTRCWKARASGRRAAGQARDAAARTKPTTLAHQRFELGIAANELRLCKAVLQLVHERIGIAAQQKSRTPPLSVAATKIDPNEHSPMANRIWNPFAAGSVSARGHAPILVKTRHNKSAVGVEPSHRKSQR